MVAPKKKSIGYTKEYLAKLDGKEEEARKASETESEVETLKAEVKVLKDRVSALEGRVSEIEQD